MSIARYHEGQRGLQDAFDSRRVADRLDELSYSRDLDAGDRAFIEAASMFFIATADAGGRPDCSYKGGAPGFVAVLSPGEIAWPDFDGNGQFRTLGNLRVNPHCGLLFIDWAKPSRLRVNGRATVSADDPMLHTWPGAQLVVRLEVAQVFPNCPRYIHRMEVVEPSPFVPRADVAPPRPGWKDSPSYRDVLPRKDRT